MASKVTRASPVLPRFVVISMTPFAPRAPYNAFEAASFSTVIDSISDVLIADISPSYGTPSTTYKGVLLADIEPIPRMRTVASFPGCPVLLVVCTPAT